MKTLNEIREEREKTARKAAELKEQAGRLREQWTNATTDEKRRYLKETPERARIMREWEEIEKRRGDLVALFWIQKNNYRAALASEVVPVLAGILEKYKGKKAGPATREKMRAEMLSACGCVFSFSANFMSAKAERAEVVELLDGGARIGEKIEVYTTNRAAMVDENNTITRAAAETLRADTAAYIENPAERLEEIKQASAELEQAKTAYNAAADKLNALLVDGFDRAEKIYR